MSVLLQGVGCCKKWHIKSISRRPTFLHCIVYCLCWALSRAACKFGWMYNLLWELLFVFCFQCLIKCQSNIRYVIGVMSRIWRLSKINYKFEIYLKLKDVKNVRDLIFYLRLKLSSPGPKTLRPKTQRGLGLTLKSYNPNPSTTPNFKQVWVGLLGSDSSPKYPWVSGRCPKSRWTAKIRTQGRPPCSSRTLSRTVLKGQSRWTSEGKIRIGPFSRRTLRWKPRTMYHKPNYEQNHEP